MELDINPIGLIILIVIATINAYISILKGFKWPTWFILTLLLGPLVTIILYFSKKKKTSLEESFTIPRDGLWFYLTKDSKQIGPISSYRVEELFEIKELSHDTYVWKEGMQEWKKLENTPLNGLLK